MCTHNFLWQWNTDPTSSSCCQPTHSLALSSPSEFVGYFCASAKASQCAVYCRVCAFCCRRCFSVCERRSFIPNAEETIQLLCVSVLRVKLIAVLEIREDTTWNLHQTSACYLELELAFVAVVQHRKTFLVLLLMWAGQMWPSVCGCRSQKLDSGFHASLLLLLTTESGWIFNLYEPKKCNQLI